MRKRMIVPVIIVVLLLAAVAFASGGKPQRSAPSWLTAEPIAHRGLWVNGPEAPENSLPAFEAAAAKGYAIELDVQRTADGALVVIHDQDIEPLTGTEGDVSRMTLIQLTDVRLRGGEELIPTLDEALATIDGTVPVLVEIKNEGEVGALEDAVAQELLAYEGPVAVISFNPYSLERMAQVAPDIPRGQLSGAFPGEDLAWYKKLLLGGLLMNWKSKPDFIAYDIRALPSLVTKVQQWRGRPVLGWTANSAEEREAAEKYTDGMICNPEALPTD